MSLDDRLANLKVEEYGTVPKSATKQAILTDLLEIIFDSEDRSEAIDKVRKYCE